MSLPKPALITLKDYQFHYNMPYIVFLNTSNNQNQLQHCYHLKSDRSSDILVIINLEYICLFLYKINFISSRELQKLHKCCMHKWDNCFLRNEIKWHLNKTKTNFLIPFLMLLFESGSTRPNLRSFTFFKFPPLVYFSPKIDWARFVIF